MFKIHNTLTRKKETFKPVNKKQVRIYTCGPTVYDYAHIGNFRSFLTADILYRWLKYLSHQVKLVKNITDVGHLTQDDLEKGEDRIIAAAKKQAKTPKALARFYEKAFLEDEAQMNILPAAVYPRATDNIQQMIAIISLLLKKGLAYEKNGSVFYDVTKFKKYGQLSGNTLNKLQAGARLEPHADKKNPYDFALWLKAEPDHLMQWDSPWSRGYPGWHIECSAMSMRYLSDAFPEIHPYSLSERSELKGQTSQKDFTLRQAQGVKSFYEANFRPQKFQTIDFHTGGEDNIFPHHEDEIAQSEGATGKQFIKYWVHTKHLLVNAKKMSKSLGNFYTLRDLIDKGYNPLAFRLLLLGAHYRSQFNFTFQGLKQAQSALDRITKFVLSLRGAERVPSLSGDERSDEAHPLRVVTEEVTIPHNIISLDIARDCHVGSLREPPRNDKINKIIKSAQQKFEKYLNDDLNTPQALAVVFDFIRDINKSRNAAPYQGTGQARCVPTKEIYNLMLKFDQVLGLGLDKIKPDKKIIIPKKVQALFKQRQAARSQKDFKKADHLRQQIESLGFKITDRKNTSVLKKL